MKLWLWLLPVFAVAMWLTVDLALFANHGRAERSSPEAMPLEAMSLNIVVKSVGQPPPPPAATQQKVTPDNEDSGQEEVDSPEIPDPPAAPIDTASVHSPKTEPVSSVEMELTIAVQTTAQTASLLRRVEQETAMEIEIAWPSDQSRAIYRYLYHCQGMRHALVKNGTLVSDFDETKFSLLARSINGVMGVAEREHVRRFKSREISGARIVRIYPRSLDAALLDGLTRLLGTTSIEGQIRGEYEFSVQGLMVVGLFYQGRAISGRIQLASQQNTQCN